MKYFICDIDGTIANLDHRLPLIQGEHKDWDKFHRLCDKDTPIEPVVNLVKHLIATGWYPIFITGRPSSSFVSFVRTLCWLEENLNFSFANAGLLHMRADGDFRHDYIVKEEIYQREVVSRDIEIEFVLEDRASVVKMWRSLGLKVLQVAEGDY